MIYYLIAAALFVFAALIFFAKKFQRTQGSLRSFKKAFETMQLGITITDVKGKILYTNPAEADMHGYSVEELIGRDVRVFAPPGLSNPMTLEQIKNMRRFKRESVNIRKDRSVFPVQLMSDVIMDADGGPLGIITTCEDITARKKAEEMLQKVCNELEIRVEERTSELKKVNEQLQKDIAKRKKTEEKSRLYQEMFRSLNVRMALLEEQEKKRISEELHDNISQNLALSKIKIAAIKESKLSSDIAGDLDKIQKLIEEAIQFTKSLTFELSLPILHKLGIEAALDWLTNNIQEKHGLEVEFVSNGKLKNLNSQTTILLYKTVRELLINIVKHSQASKARVVLVKDNSNIRITVEDNGIGFDIKKLYGDSGKIETFGLFNINERINHIGGIIKIESEPKQGTLIDLIVPIE